MQIEIGIPLIILGFLTPILLYMLYRRYQRKKALARITDGEIFDKDGTRFVIDNDGRGIEIPKKKSMALQNAVNRMKVW